MQITPDQLRDEAAVMALELRFKDQLLARQAAEIERLKAQHEQAQKDLEEALQREE